MADIWIDVDAALAEVPVNILPLIDDADFKTIEGAVAYNAAGMALRWHFVTSAGAYTVTSVTPTSGGDYDWTDQGDSGIYTIEIPASGGASINNDTEGFGWFTGVATGVLPWRGPIVGFRAAGLNDALIESAWSATRGLAGTALPAAAADAAGGLIISDAGGLDADAQRSDVAAILVDTGTTLDGRLPAALVSGRIDASVGAMANNVLTAAAINADAITAAKIADGAIDAATFAANAITSTVLANDAITAAKLHADVTTELQSGLATAAALATVDGIVDDILLDTAEIGAAGAGLTNINLPNQTMDIVGNITGNLSGSVGSVTGAVGSVTTVSDKTGYRLSATGVDDVWDEALSGHTTSGTAGQRIQTIRANTAQAGAATTITLDASASAVDDFYNGSLIHITAGTGALQSRVITDYDGTTKVATVATWATNPSSDSVFQILPGGGATIIGTVDANVVSMTAGGAADFFTVDSGETYGDAVAGSVVAEIADNAGGSALTVGAIADAVWDEATAGHTTSGTFGEQLKTDVDAILVDTNELQTDWVDGGRLDLILDARASQTSVNTIDDFLDTEVAAILADTNELQTDWADGGRLDVILDARASQSSVNTIDDFLDTEIADILTDTSTTIDDLVDDLEGRLTAALATQLTAHSLAVLRGVTDAGSTTTAVVILTINGAAASATDDFYNGRHMVFTSGALAGQATSISDYAGATKIATVPGLTGAPASAVTFVIV